MHRRKETARAKFDRQLERCDQLAKVLQTSKAVQLRYQLIPSRMLNNVVRAGVLDTRMGRMKNGKHTGKFVVRVNNPSHGRSNYHRITVDPKGFPSSKNPHIPVSPEVVTAASKVQKGLQVAGKVALVVSVIMSGVRIGKAIYDEIDIDSEIEAWQSIVECLEEDVNNYEGEEAEQVRESLNFAREMWEDAKDCKRTPGKKTALATLCIGAEWGGAAAIGLAGAEGGAALGLVGGPIGGIVGAITGGVVGAVVGSEMGASAVQNFRVDDDGLATEMQGSIIKAGDASVLPCDANFFVGKGVEVGARTSLLHLHDGHTHSVDLGKVGASVGISNKGVELGVEGKVAWGETDCKTCKYGFGVKVDTGVELSSNNASIKFLGFGFSNRNDGFELSTPFFSFTTKK
ncbi:unnamed protein product [Nippostrongylus brasiliensis]|uniref:Gly-zipper_Omp domain-containing protein n=1 Tax=Nippostrongylus brasiliensis TaxID=27835 RepID=A0A0N4XZP1_NIPBR|nr:unnamed protein product [Nippostrongylus brasiliensis]